MKRTLHTAILFLMLAVCVSVTVSAQDHGINPTMKKKGKLDTVKVQGFRAKETMQIMQDSGASSLLLLIDVRSAAEFATGHIKGAINVPLDEVEARLKELKKKYFDRTIITMDEEGRNGMTACGILTANKFAWAYYLKGGLKGWRAENFPLEK